VPDESRTDEQIRREITTEREQLVGALGELRASASEARRRAAIVGGALAAGFAAAKAIKFVLRRSRG
jgi:hypothetical protein